jgi:hypothetical protein
MMRTPTPNPRPTACLSLGVFLSWVPHSERLVRRVGLGFSRGGAALARPVPATSQRLAALWVTHTPSSRVGLGSPPCSTQEITSVIANAVRELRNPSSCHPTLASRDSRDAAPHALGFSSKLNFPHPTYVSINGIMEPMPTPQTTTAPATSIPLREGCDLTMPEGAYKVGLRHPNHFSSRCSAAPSSRYLGLPCSGRSLDRPVFHHHPNHVIPNAVREVRNPFDSHIFRPFSLAFLYSETEN